jgi:hypothetical protein
LNTIFRALVIALLVLACVKLHEIAQHTRLAGTALAIIALRAEEPKEKPHRSAPSDSRVVDLGKR